MRIALQVTTDKKPAFLAIGLVIKTRCLWIGFCAPWEVIESGIPWWRVWLFDNRSEAGKGGILYGLVRWIFT